MDNSTKKAIAYSLLAHIRNSGTLSKGPLDIFIPIVKKGLHFMNYNKEQYKGESILEIQDIIFKSYGIDIPVPVLKSILIVISLELNKKDENIFTLNNDNSFWVKDYVFEDYDQKIQEYQTEVTSLQKLFGEFCKANGIKDSENNCIIKFIEKNKFAISKYLTNSKTENGQEYIIEAKFIEYFKHNATVFSLIKNIYLGSILTCYLEYQPTDVKMDVILLLDTNFIISLIDLNTPESTHTCNKLIEVCRKIGYDFRVLSDTIEETKSLLNHKACNYDNAIILKYVNKEDIYNACERRNLSRTDLDRIADNLENIIQEFGISIVPYTESLKNKAKFSPEYKLLKNYRNSDKAALHDAEAIIYVKEKRGKKIKEFELVNCWFVNNSVTHDSDNEGIKPLLHSSQQEFQPEIIKVDDLLNILWLSNPSINIAIANDEMVDIGLTALVAFTLNEALPKARVIKELDTNIQKYKDESISDKDVLLLSTRIASGQFKNIEKLNELAIHNPAKFNEGIKDEARKQEELEKDRIDKFEKLFNKLNEEVGQISSYKVKIDKAKELEIQKIQNVANTDILKKDEEIKRLKKENTIIENKRRKTEREVYLAKIMKEWRRKTWIAFSVCITLLIFGVIWTIISLSNLPLNSDNFFEKILQNKFIAISISIVTTVINYFIIRALYDKYQNHSNINSYKSNILIPDELKDLTME